MSDTARLTIVMPVFNDWESAAFLLRDIDRAMADAGVHVEILMVDDCSVDQAPARFVVGQTVQRVECLRLAANVGHQRAIAVGLTTLAERGRSGLVAVMDSDGEDRPEELRRIVDLARAEPARAFVAQRKQRSESWLFRAFYKLYVLLFRLLTGQRINFGNFTVLSINHVSRLVHDQNIWNHFAAALVRSRVPVTFVPTRRGMRYAGTSRMNFVGLVAHGLGAISVFSEAVFIRILIASACLFFLSTGLGAAALYLRLFTDLALPNWATTVLGFSLVISIQALMMPILMAFMLLNARSTIQPLPNRMILQLVAESFEIDVERKPELAGRGLPSALAN